MPASLRLPPDLAEVVRLAASKMDESAILAFVQNSAPFRPITPDEIVYLKDLGITPRVLTALLQHQQQEPGNLTPAAIPQAQYAEAPYGLENYGQEMPSAENPMGLPQDSEMAGALPGPGYYNPVDYGYVYNALSPYGAWLNMPGFGWCWQPTIGTTCRDWRPYCDNGSWRWSEAGWYWDSHYTWGGVPFHYGRWWQDPQQGWLWRPDRVWAPAWVSWRGSGDVCGWAPLPPGADFNVGRGWTFRGQPVDPARGGFGLTSASYTFVNPEHFQQPAGHGLGGAAAREAFRHTTPTERNGFVFGADQRIVNLGIDPFLVEQTAPKAARPVVASFPGGESFTAVGSGGQLPFNLHRRAQKPSQEARGGSTLPAEEPVTGGAAAQAATAGVAGGGGGATLGHVPQYPASRNMAEATSEAAQPQNQAPAAAAAQSGMATKQVVGSTGPAAGTTGAVPFSKPAVSGLRGTGGGAHR